MSWQRVRGHDNLIDDFDRALRRGRLAHAYLFVGPPGVGKRRFAGELARALLCEGRGDRLEACDKCPSCFLLDGGTHPDCFCAARPDQGQDLPIDTIRELCASFALKTARGRGKVLLLDDADDLSDEAANCFLKTLEEPPPGSVLLLIGTSTDRQLPTIRSRCQVIRFAPLAAPLVVEILRGQGVEDAAHAETLAALSGGSPGLALLLHDPVVWAFYLALDVKLGTKPLDSVALGRLCTEFIEEAGKESFPQRRRAALVLQLVIGWIRNQLATTAEPERLLAALDRCFEAEGQVDRIKPTLVVEAAVDGVVQRLG